MTPTATSLFSGGGGDTEGMTQAGLRVVMAANHSPVAIATHRANHPRTHSVVANLLETDFNDFPRTNFCWVSASCRGHSPGNNQKPLSMVEERQRKDPASIDRATAFAMLEATDIHRYDAVIMENVPEFRNWVLFPMLVDGMALLRYRFQEVMLNAADVGPNPVAQNRKRWFGVFTPDGNVDLSLPATIRTPATAILEPDLGKLVTRRMYITPQIEEITERNVPHLVVYRKHAHAQRADENQLATVTAGGNHHAIATLTRNGPVQRLLNNRERARAQGFPRDYRFCGTPKEELLQIGNAVPVNVARFLAVRVAEALGMANELEMAA